MSRSGWCRMVTRLLITLCRSWCEEIAALDEAKGGRASHATQIEQLHHLGLMTSSRPDASEAPVRTAATSSDNKNARVFPVSHAVASGTPSTSTILLGQHLQRRRSRTTTATAAERRLGLGVVSTAICRRYASPLSLFGAFDLTAIPHSPLRQIPLSSHALVCPLPASLPLRISRCRRQNRTRRGEHALCKQRRVQSR